MHKTPLINHCMLYPRSSAHLDVRLLQQLKQLLELLGDVSLGGQDAQDLDVDFHGIRQDGREFVIFQILGDFVVNVHQRVERLALQEIAEKVELLVGAARYQGSVRLQGT